MASCAEAKCMGGSVKGQGKVTRTNRWKGGTLSNVSQDVLMMLLTWVPVRDLFRCMRVEKDWYIVLRFLPEDMSPFEPRDAAPTVHNRNESPRGAWKPRLRHPVWNEHYQRIVFLRRHTGGAPESKESIAAQVTQLVLSISSSLPPARQLLNDGRTISVASVMDILQRPLQHWQARLARLYDDHEALLQTSRPWMTGKWVLQLLFVSYGLELWTPFMSMLTESRFFLDLIRADPTDFAGMNSWLASIFIKFDTWTLCTKLFITDALEASRVARVRNIWHNTTFLGQLAGPIQKMSLENKLYYSKFKRATDPVTEIMSHLNEAVTYACFSNLPGSREAHKESVKCFLPNCRARLLDLDIITVYDVLTLLRDAPDFAHFIKH